LEEVSTQAAFIKKEQKIETSNIVRYHYGLKWLTISICFSVINSCDVKAEFSASLLQSSVSHDPSETSLI